MTEAEAFKLFSVPDFVGDACKAIASRVRGAVAQVQFDDFHKVQKLVIFEPIENPFLVEFCSHYSIVRFRIGREKQSARAIQVPSQQSGDYEH